MKFTRIGRYEPKELLGAGGFASVYKALDPRLEDTVAVKVLAENWSSMPEVRKRFRSEAVILRRLQTEYEVSGFVNVFDIDETEQGQPFFVMSYANRGTLAARIGARPLTLDDVLPVIRSMSHSLALLHGLGYIHRDLKPSNIFFQSKRTPSTASSGLLQPGERVLVSDLGMAKDLNNQTMSGLSMAGGTPRYMAPEQHEIGGPIDHRADIYAASVLLELLVDEPTESLRQALAVGKAQDPVDRPATMREWYQSVLSTTESTNPPVGPARTPSRPAPSTPPPNTGTKPKEPATEKSRPPRTRVRNGLVIAAVLAVLALGSLTMFLRWSSDSRIAGPGTIKVGEAVTYQADVDSVESMFWTDWNGDKIDDSGLVVRPRLPGKLTFFLTADGQTTERTVTVEASTKSPDIEGPTRSNKDETAVFRPVLHQETTDHYWVDPTGREVTTEDLSLVLSTPGEVTIILFAIDADGVERGERHTVTVSNG